MPRDTKANVIVRLLGDVTGFSSAMKKAQWQTMTLGQKLDLVSAKARAVGTTMTIGMTVPIVAGLAAATKAAMDDERSQRALEQQIRNTVEASDAQIASVEEFINVQARATGVADDELRPAFAKLVTATGDVTKAQELLAVAQDTAAGTGRGLDSVITAMMKGTQGQVDLFGRMGVQTRTAAGEMMTFDEVVANLKTKFDGLAATKADPFAKMRVAFGELAESVGTFLVPAMTALADKLSALAAWFENLSEGQRKFGVAAAVVVAALGPLVYILGSIVSIGRGVIAVYRGIVAVMTLMNSVYWTGVAQIVAHRVAMLASAAAAKVAAAAQWLWNAAMSANPIGLVIAAIAALVAAFVILYKKNETFRSLVDAVWGGFKTAVGWVYAQLKKLWGWVSDHQELFAAAFNAFFWPIKLAIGWATTLIGLLRDAYDYISKLGGGATTTGGATGGKGRSKIGPATGGLTTGPLSGYSATLHGTELVVPLNGNSFDPQLYNYGGGATVVNVYLDGRLIEKQVTKRQSERLRRLERAYA